MKPQHGFSLIELAIVLVIITVLIGGLAVPLTAQIQSRRIAETSRTLEEARETIIGYAMSHTVASSCTCNYNEDTTLKPTPDSSCPISLCPSTGTTLLTLPITRHYLPCPDTDNDGKENRTAPPPTPAPCGSSSGLLPWVDLATAAQDAWGNRLRYSVTKDQFADSTKGFSNTDLGNLNVCSTSAGGCATGAVADKVPVVLVSYGPNGWGAQSSNGTILATPTGDDEKANITGQFYVSRPPYQPKDGSVAEQAKEFDDLVVWISDGLLKSRVCPAGGCP